MGVRMFAGRGSGGGGQLRQEGVAMGVKGGQEGPVTLPGGLDSGEPGGPAGQGSSGAIQACSLHTGPPSPGSQVRLGEGARGQEGGGRKEGQGLTPAQEREEAERTWPTASTLLLLATHPRPPNFSHPEPGAASEATPLAGRQRGKRLVQAQAGGAGRNLLLSSLSPTPGGWQNRHDGSSIHEVERARGPVGATEGGHRQWEEGSGDALTVKV